MDLAWGAERAPTPGAPPKGRLRRQNTSSRGIFWNLSKLPPQFFLQEFFVVDSRHERTRVVQSQSAADCEREAWPQGRLHLNQ